VRCRSLQGSAIIEIDPTHLRGGGRLTGEPARSQKSPTSFNRWEFAGNRRENLLGKWNGPNCSEARTGSRVESERALFRSSLLHVVREPASPRFRFLGSGSRGRRSWARAPGAARPRFLPHRVYFLSAAFFSAGALDADFAIDVVGTMMWAYGVPFHITHGPPLVQSVGYASS
jgi:hypothetical protein